MSGDLIPTPSCPPQVDHGPGACLENSLCVGQSVATKGPSGRWQVWPIMLKFNLLELRAT